MAPCKPIRKTTRMARKGRSGCPTTTKPVPAAKNSPPKVKRKGRSGCPITKSVPAKKSPSTVKKSPPKVKKSTQAEQICSNLSQKPSPIRQESCSELSLPKRSSSKPGMRPGPIQRNPFLNFLRQYRKQSCGLSAVEIACQGAEAWKRLTKEQKMRFVAQAFYAPKRKRCFKKFSLPICQRCAKCGKRRKTTRCRRC